MESADLYQDVLISRQGWDRKFFNSQGLSRLNDERFPFLRNSHDFFLYGLKRYIVKEGQSRIINAVLEFRSLDRMTPKYTS